MTLYPHFYLSLKINLSFIIPIAMEPRMVLYRLLVKTLMAANVMHARTVTSDQLKALP